MSILKLVDAYWPYLIVLINDSLFKGEYFPCEELKQSEVVILYKKLDPLKKKNYRPVTLLSCVSKVFGRIIYKQINIEMEDKLSNVWQLSDYLTQPNISLQPRKMGKISWHRRMCFCITFRSLKCLRHNQSWPFTSKIKGLWIITKCTKINV